MTTRLFHSITAFTFSFAFQYGNIPVAEGVQHLNQRHQAESRLKPGGDLQGGREGEGAHLDLETLEGAQGEGRPRSQDGVAIPHGGEERLAGHSLLAHGQTGEVPCAIHHPHQGKPFIQRGPYLHYFITLMLRSYPHIKDHSRRATQDSFRKIEWMCLSCGSYGVYVAVTGLCSCFRVYVLLFFKINVLRGSFGTALCEKVTIIISAMVTLLSESSTSAIPEGGCYHWYPDNILTLS